MEESLEISDSNLDTMPQANKSSFSSDIRCRWDNSGIPDNYLHFYYVRLCYVEHDVEHLHICLNEVHKIKKSYPLNRPWRPTALWVLMILHCVDNQIIDGCKLLRNDMALLRSLRRLLVTANVVPSSQNLVTLMMEALRSSETSVLTRTTRLNIREDGILYFYQVPAPLQ
jgi:hypothetical protein